MTTRISQRRRAARSRAGLVRLDTVLISFGHIGGRSVRHCYDERATKGCDRWTSATGWRTGSRPTAPTCGRWPTGCSARVSEADDAVQEAWLRLSRSDAAEIENLGGVADDRRRAGLASTCCARARRGARSRLGPHVPEPIVSREDGVDPEHEALLADSVGLALLVVLETLGPAERLAFVLHDMFAVPFDEIAPIVDRSPDGDAAARAAARAAAFAGPRRRRTPTSPPARGRRRLPRRRARRRLRGARSRCSTPTSCCAPTAGRCAPARRGRSAARRPWPSRRARLRAAFAALRPACARQRCRRLRRRAARPAARGRRASRSRAGRSSRSTCSPTLPACGRLDLAVLDD